MGANNSSNTIFQPESWTQHLPLNAMFERVQPLEVDLGCGKGRFLLARAKANPQINYLGVDRLLGRLRKIDRNLLKLGLANVRLLRIEAAYAADFLFPPDVVSAMYIFFPDPWPKRRHQKRRLFTRSFLDSVERMLLPGGQVHAATDDMAYFEHIREVLRSDRRFQEVEALELCAEERTNFEAKFVEAGLEIGRCSYQKVQS